MPATRAAVSAIPIHDAGRIEMHLEITQLWCDAAEQFWVAYLTPATRESVA